MLKETYIELLSNYTDQKTLIEQLWLEIEKNYTDNKRHYHNLHHLEHLLNELKEVKDQIKDWNCILFTLFYHDVIYNALKTDNEAQSAEFAEKRMLQIHVPNDIIQNCKSQIMATKSHHISKDSDSNYFIDADLSVLGQAWETYIDYFKNVRKEYAIYPDFVYNPGRKKVLNHFITMDSIFKTDYFYTKYEQQAKINLNKEFQLL